MKTLDVIALIAAAALAGYSLADGEISEQRSPLQRPADPAAAAAYDYTRDYLSTLGAQDDFAKWCKGRSLPECKDEWIRRVLASGAIASRHIDGPWIDAESADDPTGEFANFMDAAIKEWKIIGEEF